MLEEVPIVEASAPAFHRHWSSVSASLAMLSSMPTFLEDL
jgi:hypothetical protein